MNDSEKKRGALILQAHIVTLFREIGDDYFRRAAAAQNGAYRERTFAKAGVWHDASSVTNRMGLDDVLAAG